MIDKPVLPKLECPQCGHEWNPRTETPVRCQDVANFYAHIDRKRAYYTQIVSSCA